MKVRERVKAHTKAKVQEEELLFVSSSNRKSSSVHNYIITQVYKSNSVRKYGSKYGSKV